jgi:hypothetical protein
LPCAECIYIRKPTIFFTSTLFVDTTEVRETKSRYFVVLHC